MGDILLKHVPAGIYHLNPAHRDAVRTACSNIPRLCLLEADIDGRTGIDGILRQLGTAFEFPIWYGANFDALHDCLTDPDWHPGRGHLLMIRGISHLRSTDPDDFATLIDVLKAAADARQEQAQPFWILIDTPARGISSFPEA